MEVEPELRLFVTLIEELGRNLARAQPIQQGSLDAFRELAGVNGHLNGLRHTPAKATGPRPEAKDQMLKSLAFCKVFQPCVDLAAIGVHIQSMSFDISVLLDKWDYQPGQVVVRKFRGEDGHDKIQLRVDLGLLQMNAKGRPDGKRPFGHESLLEHYQELLERFRREHANDDKTFRLTPDDCSKLQQEAIQYHHRYICLFQLEDFDGVIHDAERNLKVFDFVQRYAGGEELAWQLQQFRPQLLMMRVRARGALALKDNLFDEVVRIVEAGMEEIRQFYTRARKARPSRNQHRASVLGNVAAGNPEQTSADGAGKIGKRAQRSRS